MVKRRLAKVLMRLAVLLTLVSIIAFVGDLFLDFLPSSLQTRLPLHSEEPVIVDIKIHQCMLKKNCPESTNVWKKIPKDLYLGESWTKQAYLYYREIPEPELPPDQEVVVMVTTGMFNPNDAEATLPHLIYDDLASKVTNLLILDIPSLAFEEAGKHGWRLVDKQLGLWVKYAKHQPNQAVTKVNVLFGMDAVYPLPQWVLPNDDGLNIGSDDVRPRIAYRVGRAEHLKRPVLRFDQNGEYRIAQVADLHMSTGPGRCDHPVPPLQPGEDCFADTRTMNFVSQVLDAEEPDLVVFSGDQIFGATSPDPETALLKALAPALERSIPFTVVWGNHDDQGPLRNSELMDIVTALPYSLSAPGPEAVPGDSNFYVGVTPHNSQYPALTLYFLDSHSKLGAKGGGDYDYIRSEQQDFLRSAANEVKEKLKGYSHVPLSMAFFHIPTPEFADGWNSPTIPRVGEQREGVASPRYNSETLPVLRSIGVSVLGVGHDHVNDFCQLQPLGGDKSDTKEKLWLCYAGGAGFGAYGGYPDASGHDFERRVRLYQINMNVPNIDTWHRIQDREDVTKSLRLVEDGKPIYKPPANPGGSHHRNSQEKIVVEEDDGSADEDKDN